MRMVQVSDRGLRILVTNDDGFYAPGLQVLEKIARELSDDVWIVAPESEQSGASHSLTLSDPLRLRQHDPRRHAVRGTPTDCVLMAVKNIMDRPPDLLLSGVNRGQNLAEDVTYSGTIAAAMEGTVLGIRSIALSQTYGFDGTRRLKWHTAEHHAPGLIRKMLDMDYTPGILLNVNFPDVEPDDVTGVEITRQGTRDQSLLVVDEREDARGVPYFWFGFERKRSNPPEGTDLRAVYQGKISITPLHLDLTHEPSIAGLRRVLASD